MNNTPEATTGNPENPHLLACITSGKIGVKEPFVAMDVIQPSVAAVVPRPMLIMKTLFEMSAWPFGV